MAGPNHDRLSLLPDGLLEDILARLPLQEVVRTSVLSKRWISLWTQISKLVFDTSFCTEPVRNDENRLMLIITNILLRSRTPILDFTFSIKGLSSVDIDPLVSYVCNNGVKYFKLEIQNPKFYDFPSLAQLRSVRHLSLKSCIVTVPEGFKGLSMLTYMNLYNVEIDGGELSSLVSSCPLLEILVLKNLQLCCYLNLAAPNLRVIRCEGFYLTFCLEFAPRFETMVVSVYDTFYDVEVDADGPEDLIVPFGVIPAIKFMALDGSFLMYMNAGIWQKMSRCRNVLNNLKVLKLTDVPFEFIEVSQNVLSLIRRSPNLETIMVTTNTEQQNDHASGVWRTEDLSDVSLNRLRHACVLNITAKKSELLFIKTLLAKSPMLENLVVRLYSGLNQEDGLRTREEILRFRRASPHVKITPKGNIIIKDTSFERQ